MYSAVKPNTKAMFSYGDERSCSPGFNDPHLVSYLAVRQSIMLKGITAGGCLGLSASPPHGCPCSLKEKPGWRALQSAFSRLRPENSPFGYKNARQHLSEGTFHYLLEVMKYLRLTHLVASTPGKKTLQGLCPNSLSQKQRSRLNMYYSPKTSCTAYANIHFRFSSNFTSDYPFSSQEGMLVTPAFFFLFGYTSCSDTNMQKAPGSVEFC